MSPRSTIDNAKIRQKSRDKIMEAAFSEFGVFGFESTSIAQIAKKAGVSKGLLYNYFESKDHLLQALILNGVRQSEKEIVNLMAVDPAITIENIIRWTFNEFRTNLDYWKLYTQLTFKLTSHKFIHDLAVTKSSEYVAFFAAQLKALNFDQPEMEARSFAALLDGVAMHYIAMEEDYPLDEMEKFLITKYCNK